MRPDARRSQPGPGQAPESDERSTYHLPQASWPVAPHARVGRGSQPPRPIERPSSLRPTRHTPVVVPPPPAPRREKRVLLFIVYGVIALVTVALVLEAIFLAVGKSLL